MRTDGLSSEELALYRAGVLRDNCEALLRDARAFLDHLDDFEEV